MLLGIACACSSPMAAASSVPPGFVGANAAPGARFDTSSRMVLMGATWAEGPGSGSPSHAIGSLRWGDDGSLLVSVGDGAAFGGPDPGGLYPDLFLPGRTRAIEDIGAFRAQFIGSLNGK